MLDYRRHLIAKGSPIKQALAQLNELAADAVLFVVDDNEALVGSLTDGDVRRGLLGGLALDGSVENFINTSPKFVLKTKYTLDQIKELRNKNYKIIPVLDEGRKILNLINFRYFKSYLPVDSVIMAGGKGERLRPLTDDTPKPLLKIGERPILEYNIKRLISFGVDDFWICVRYLGEQIERHFKNGDDLNVSIKYIWENHPLGTIGAVAGIRDFKHDYVLVTNSDILTNIDYEDFFAEFLRSQADLSVATIPYQVSVPFAVMETDNGHVLSFREKPTYTYYSNGGIYLMKKEVLNLIPKDRFFNATDLMESLIASGRKVHSFPVHGYWLDIGRPEDYEKAQDDIKHISF